MLKVKTYVVERYKVKINIRGCSEIKLDLLYDLLESFNNLHLGGDWYSCDTCDKEGVMELSWELTLQELTELESLINNLTGRTCFL